MDQINIELKFKQLVLSGKFLEAYKIVHNFSKDILEKVLFEIGCDEHSISAYSFVCFLLMKHETTDLHCLASRLLNIAFCHFEGAYQSSLYHIERAIEICPEDIELKEALLFFNEIPEKVVGDKEAEEIAHLILREDPTSNVALRFFAEKEMSTNKNSVKKSPSIKIKNSS